MKLILFLCVVSASLTAHAQSLTPQGITLQGRIIKPDSTPLEAASVTFTVEVRSPDPDDCLLYTENQTLVMTGSSGIFSFSVGSGSRSGTNFENVSTLAQVFNNSSTTISPVVCTSGATSYTPASTHKRKVRLSFDDGSGPQLISQAMDVQSVPYALYADTLQGKPASGYLQVNTASGKALSQANLESVFQSSSYVTELLSLIAGTSTQYASSGGGGGNFNFGTGKLYVDGTSGNVGVGTATPAYLLDVSKSQNASTTINVANANSGVTAAANVLTTSDAGTTQMSTVSTAAGGYGRISSNSQSLALDAQNASGFLSFRTGAAPTERMRVTSTGSVGIGTSVPGAALEVRRDVGGGYVKPLLVNGNAGVGSSNAVLLAINNVSSGKAGIEFQNNGSPRWEMIADSCGAGCQDLSIVDLVASATRLYVDGSGNVGIGTTIPLSGLDVRSSTVMFGTATDDSSTTRSNAVTDSIYISRSANADSNSFIGSGYDHKAVIASRETSQYGVKNGAEIILHSLVTSVGSPVTGGANLDVSPGSNVELYFKRPGTPGAGTFNTATAFNDGTTSITPYGQFKPELGFILNSAGNVGIGNTSPSFKLDVSGVGVFGGGSANLDQGQTVHVDLAPLEFQAKTLIGYNYTGGGGETDFVMNRGYGIEGGYSFYEISNFGVVSPLLRIKGDGTVGIGTISPSVSLDLGSKTDALRLPNGTTAQEPASPTAGLIRYNTNSGTPPGWVEFYNGSAWVNLVGSSTAGNLTNVGNITGTGAVTISPGGTTQNLNLSNTTGGAVNVTTSAGNIMLQPGGTGSVTVPNATASIGTTSGALVVGGGIGVAGAINAGGAIATSSTVSAGTSLIAPALYGSTLASQNLIIDSTSNAAKGNVLIAQSGGNVGIGTASPSQKLEISQNTNADVLSTITNLYIGKGAFLRTQSNSDYSAYIAKNGSQEWVAGLWGSGQAFVLRDNTYGTNPLTVESTAPAYALFVQATGKIGMGTGSPDAALQISTAGEAQLHLSSSTANARLALSGGGGAGIIQSDSQLTLIANSSSAISFQPNGSEKMRINSGGNVGIGTATPAASLAIQGQTSDSSASSLLVTNSSGLPMIQARNDGNIGIDMAPSFANLNIGGNGTTYSVGGDPLARYQGYGGTPRIELMAAKYDSTASEAGHEIGRVDIGGYNGSGWVNQAASMKGIVETTWTGASNPTALTFSTTTGTTIGERMRVTSAGNVGIGLAAPGTSLDVNGGIRAGASTVVNVTCNAGNEGIQRYNYVTHSMEFCNGTNWMQVPAQIAGSTANVTTSGPPVNATIYPATVTANYTPAFGAVANVISGVWPGNGTSAYNNASCVSLYDTGTGPAQAIVLDLGAVRSIGNIYAYFGSIYYMSLTVTFSTDGVTYNSSMLVNQGYVDAYSAQALSPTVTARYVRLANGHPFSASGQPYEAVCQFAVGP